VHRTRILEKMQVDTVAALVTALHHCETTPQTGHVR